MSEHLNSEEEDLLQSALSTAFSPAPLPRQTVAPEPAPDTSSPSAPAPEPLAQATAAAPTNPGEPESTETVWKEEYEAHVAEWRRRSAEQRQKAEETRAEWEAIREQERKQGQAPQSVLSESTSGWENLSVSVAASGSVASPSPADSRALVTGEGEGGHSKEYLETVLPGAPTATSTSTTPPSQPTSEPESSKQDKWDSMASSLTSSFPSMSFPSDPHSPLSSGARRDLPPHLAHDHVHPAGHGHGHGHAHGAHQHHHPHQPQPPQSPRTATLSVFDTSLSPKTRALALLSSAAINVLLPFVNGVMLGFGEIFAKNLVNWLGWRVHESASAASSRGSGRVASGVGLGRR